MSGPLKHLAARTIGVALVVSTLACTGDDAADDTDTGPSATTSTSGADGTDTTTDAETSNGSTSSSSTAAEGASTGGEDRLPTAYCDCMLINCHEPFHEMWGEEDFEATMNCRAAAAELPQNGEPTMEGEFLECRMAFCESGLDDPAACDAALGGPPCQ